jgi:hypothetical protein
MAVTIVTFIVIISTFLIMGVDYSAYSIALASLINGILLGLIVRRL